MFPIGARCRSKKLTKMSHHDATPAPSEATTTPGVIPHAQVKCRDDTTQEITLVATQQLSANWNTSSNVEAPDDEDEIKFLNALQLSPLDLSRRSTSSTPVNANASDPADSADWSSNGVSEPIENPHEQHFPNPVPPKSTSPNSLVMAFTVDNILNPKFGQEAVVLMKIEFYNQWGKWIQFNSAESQRDRIDVNKSEVSSSKPTRAPSATSACFSSTLSASSPSPSAQSFNSGHSRSRLPQRSIKRIHLETRRELEKRYQETKYPDYEDKGNLADQLNLTRYQIHGWFMNRRYKDRVQARKQALNSPEPDQTRSIASRGSTRRPKKSARRTRPEDSHPLSCLPQLYFRPQPVRTAHSFPLVDLTANDSESEEEPKQEEVILVGYGPQAPFSSGDYYPPTVHKWLYRSALDLESTFGIPASVQPEEKQDSAINLSSNASNNEPAVLYCSQA